MKRRPVFCREVVRRRALARTVPHQDQTLTDTRTDTDLATPFMVGRASIWRSSVGSSQVFCFRESRQVIKLTCRRLCSQPVGQPRAGLLVISRSINSYRSSWGRTDVARYPASLVRCIWNRIATSSFNKFECLIGIPSQANQSRCRKQR
jgi:hypothetical protein